MSLDPRLLEEVRDLDRAIRKAFPLAEISLIAMPFVAELVKRSPQIDRFIPFYRSLPHKMKSREFYL